MSDWTKKRFVIQTYMSDLTKRQAVIQTDMSDLTKRRFVIQTDMSEIGLYYCGICTKGLFLPKKNLKLWIIHTKKCFQRMFL